MRKGYVVIMGWMFELGLNLSETIVFATIWGYSQDGESAFRGSQSYLASRCLCSLATVKRILLSLEEKGLIEKSTFRNANGVLICEYRGIAQNELGVAQNELVNQKEERKEKEKKEKKEEIKNNKEENIFIKENSKKISNKFFISSVEKASVGFNPDAIADLKRKKFIEMVKPYASQKGIPPETLQGFIDYWCEHSNGSDKLRVEDTDFFDIGKRLGRWLLNDRKRNPQSNSQPQSLRPATSQEDVRKMYGK